MASASVTILIKIWGSHLNTNYCHSCLSSARNYQHPHYLRLFPCCCFNGKLNLNKTFESYRPCLPVLWFLASQCLFVFLDLPDPGPRKTVHQIRPDAKMSDAGHRVTDRRPQLVGGEENTKYTVKYCFPFHIIEYLYVYLCTSPNSFIRRKKMLNLINLLVMLIGFSFFNCSVWIFKWFLTFYSQRKSLLIHISMDLKYS